MPAVNLKAAGMKAKPRRTSNGGCKRGFRHNDFRSSFDHPEESWGLAVFRGQGSDFGRHGSCSSDVLRPKGAFHESPRQRPGKQIPRIASPERAAQERRSEIGKCGWMPITGRRSSPAPERGRGARDHPFRFRSKRMDGDKPRVDHVALRDKHRLRPGLRFLTPVSFFPSLPSVQDHLLPSNEGCRFRRLKNRFASLGLRHASRGQPKSSHGPRFARASVAGKRGPFVPTRVRAALSVDARGQEG